jgi:hypothetical protein
VAKPTLDEVFLTLTGHDTGDADKSGEAVRDELFLEVR